MRTRLMLALAGGAALYAARRARRQRRMDFAGRVVLVTGGSRGLGLELARAFAREGARVALTARDAAALDRARDELAAYADVTVHPADLRDPAQLERLLQDVHAAHGGLDVLVNNAGVIQAGPEAHMTEDDVREALDIHLWAPLRLARLAAPLLQGGGRIVNVSSVGGLVAVPHLLPYSVSKHALTALSDGLRAEWAADGIHVTTVCPGLMRTGSHVNAFFKGQHRKEFAWFSVSDASPLLSMASGDAAAAIVEACRYGDAHLTLTLPARFLAAADALAPSAVGRAMQWAARLLPGPTDDPAGDERRRGWDSRSAASPSPLTRPADRAVPANNEWPGG